MIKSDRLKLAKAARELASEFAEGRGPKLVRYNWCGCAAGQLMRRAGLDLDGGSAPAVLDESLDLILTGATRREFDGENGEGPLQGAVVFAYLWAADELESQP